MDSEWCLEDCRRCCRVVVVDSLCFVNLWMMDTRLCRRRLVESMVVVDVCLICFEIGRSVWSEEQQVEQHLDTKLSCHCRGCESVRVIVNFVRLR